MQKIFKLLYHSNLGNRNGFSELRKTFSIHASSQKYNKYIYTEVGDTDGDLRSHGLHYLNELQGPLEDAFRMYFEAAKNCLKNTYCFTVFHTMVITERPNPF